MLTPNQAAAHLQVDKETIYRLIRSHQLAATRIGGRYRIPREDLDAYLLAHGTRSVMRDALFDRVLAIAHRNPGLDSDALLEELERADQDGEVSAASSPAR